MTADDTSSDTGSDTPPIAVAGPVIPLVGVPVQRSPYNTAPPVSTKILSPIDLLPKGPAPQPTPKQEPVPARGAAVVAEAPVQVAEPARGTAVVDREIRLTEQLMPLVGAVKRRKQREPQADDGERDAVDAAIAAVPWVDWLAGDHRLSDTCLADSCGCPIYHWHTAENWKSATLHECAHAPWAHIWSGTMIADLGISENERAPWLAAALQGRPAHQIASEFGVSLRVGGGEDPTDDLLSPDGIEDAAVELERAGELEKAARRREVADVMREAVAKRTGAVPVPTFRVSGGITPPPEIPPVDGETGAVDVDEPQPDALTLAQRKCEDLMAQADAPEMLDSIFYTPLLHEIRRRAGKAQASPMLALSANLSGVLSVVPVKVTLPKLTGKKRSPLNLITVGIDESGGGKGGLTCVDIEPVPHGWVGPITAAMLPEGYTGPNSPARIPCTETAGSGEAIATAYALMEKGTDGAMCPVMHTPANWFAWDEVTKVLAVRDRKSSTIDAELSQGWSGEKLGSRTKTSPAYVEPMSYRFLCSIAGQPATAAALMDNEFQGILQRMWFVSGAYRITDTEADPAALAEGRRTEDGWFREPDDDEPLIRVELPEWPGNGLIPVHGDVAEVFERERAEHGRGERKHPWDRHENLLRLRLATAGALMHGQLGVTWAWWQWAGLLLDHHKMVRAAVQAMRGVARQKEATAAGKSDAARADARDAARWEQAVEATLAWAKQRKEFTANRAVKATSGYREEKMGDIIAHLVEIGKLTWEQRPVHNRPHELTVYYRAV